MKLEQSIFQKLNTFSDWVIRIIMINVLMILTSLPIITIYSSLSSGYQLMHDYINKDETHLFKGYFKYFFENLKKKIFMSILITLALFLTILNVTYYVEILKTDPNILYTIGYYVTIAAMIGVYVISIHSFSVVLVFKQISIMKTFKIAFYISGRYFFRTILLIAINLIPVAMFATPITIFVFVFAGLSIPLLLNAIVTNPIVSYLEGLGVKRG